MFIDEADIVFWLFQFLSNT